MRKLSVNPRTEAIALSLLIAVAVVQYWADFRVAWDLTEYLTLAINHFNGVGFTDIDRNSGAPAVNRWPVFSALLSFTFGLTGKPTVGAAAAMVAFFCVLTLLSFYLFARRLFGPAIALGALLVYMSIANVQYAAYRHLDTVWLVPAFLGLAILPWDWTAGRWRDFLFAGLLVGAAYLVKETALFLLGWPAAAMFGQLTRLAQIPWLKIAVFYLGFGLIISAAFLTLYSGSSGVQVLGAYEAANEGGPAAERENLPEGSSTRILPLHRGLWRLVTAEPNGYLVRIPIAAALLLSTFLLALWVRRTPVRILLGLVVLFLPIASFIGNAGWRFGQSLFLVACLSLALVVSASSLMEWLSRRFHTTLQRPGTWYLGVLLLLVLANLLIQPARGPSWQDIWPKTVLAKLVAGKPTELHLTGWTEKSIYQPLLEIEKAEQNRPSIVIGGRPYARGYYFFSGGDAKLHDLPFLWCRGQMSFGQTNLAETRQETPLFITSINQPRRPNFGVWIVYQSQLLETLRGTQAGLLALSSRFDDLGAYLEAHPAFARLAGDGSGSVWSVDQAVLQAIDHPVIETGRFKKALKSLRKMKRDPYQHLKFIQFCSDYYAAP